MVSRIYAKIKSSRIKGVLQYMFPFSFVPLRHCMQWFPNAQNIRTHFCGTNKPKRNTGITLSICQALLLLALKFQKCSIKHWGHSHIFKFNRSQIPNIYNGINFLRWTLLKVFSIPNKPQSASSPAVGRITCTMMYKEAELNPWEEVGASCFSHNYIMTSWPLNVIYAKWAGVFKVRSLDTLP